MSSKYFDRPWSPSHFCWGGPGSVYAHAVRLKDITSREIGSNAAVSVDDVEGTAVATVPVHALTAAHTATIDSRRRGLSARCPARILLTVTISPSPQPTSLVGSQVAVVDSTNGKRIDSASSSPAMQTQNHHNRTIESYCLTSFFLCCDTRSDSGRNAQHRGKITCAHPSPTWTGDGPACIPPDE